jgi:dynein heavy chain
LRFLDDFSKYDWLWKNRIDDMLRKFNSQEPTLEDFENELLKFSEFESDIRQIQDQKQIGALSLKTKSVKEGLDRWIKQWQTTYAKDLLRQASSQVEALKDDMKHIRLKIEKPAQDIDSLGNVMHALSEIRAKQADIEISFRPVIDMYRILDNYIHDLVEKEDIDPQQILDKDWQELVLHAGTVRDEL